jgi:nitrite reductase/ring-hydroxylating ferredoxin subunit
MSLDNFAALRQEPGSVRLRVTGMPTSFSEIIVTRLEGSQFFAVTSRCTHQGTTISTLNASTGLLRCPNHGSQFQPDGTLVNGPATTSLAAYQTSFDGNKLLSIEIPGLGFLVTLGSAINSSNQKRVRLEFPTVTGVRYGVQFRSALGTGAWSSVPFSTTVDGAATQTALNGNNAKATVFVEPSSQSGFYAILRGA